MILVSCIVMMSGCVVYASCLSSSCLLVMPLMLTCNMDMPVARGVLIGLCGVFLGVVASFLLFACVGVECCVGVAVWFRTCALAPAPAYGLAAHTDVGPGFDSTSPAKSIRTGDLAGITEKSGAVGAFGKAGRVDTICIQLRDVGPTAEKLYLSDHLSIYPSIYIRIYICIHTHTHRHMDKGDSTNFYCFCL